MLNQPTATPASILVNILIPGIGQPPPTDTKANQAMSDFLADITALELRINRAKQWSKDHLAEQIFRCSPVFKNAKALQPYMKYQLRVAVDELKLLDQEMRKTNNGLITFATLSQYGDVIRDYLFDLRDILVFLQRNVPNWTFFEGGKSFGVSSWEVYGLARGLAYQSTYTGTGAPFRHKTAQIASIFVLRQAMELRFERLIAVYPTDPKGKSPRLRHGFHLDFIAANPQLFLANGFDIKKLRHLYDWCSEIVHQAYQPYAWQISTALSRAGELLHTRQTPPGQAWSIYNAVEINDVGAMQTAFEQHFLTTYGHGIWKMTRTQPEALIRNWQPEMAFTNEDYRPVVVRKNLFLRIWQRIMRIFRSN